MAIGSFILTELEKFNLVFLIFITQKIKSTQN